MSKIKNFFKKIIPTKRKLIQLYAALLYNAQLSGFITGKIYKGPLKKLCVPGMNCYSCPGAVGACPLGSLQNELAASKTKAPTYILGIILLYCIMLGRWICGWICPGGLFQELLYKIKTPKLRKNRVTRILSYFKYVLLFVLVISVPLMFGLSSGATVPGFCKYVCPIGTFEGAIFLLGNKANTSLFSSLGPLFTWKFCLLIIFIVGSIFIFRFFCRFFCPLGALYGLFNKLSILGIKVDKSKCNNCGACVSKCKMDVKQVGDHECIQCGECIDVCKQCAIKWKLIGNKIKEEALSTEENETMSLETGNQSTTQNESAVSNIALENTTNDNNVSEIKEQSKPKKKVNKRTIYQIIVGSLMAISLVLVFIFTNISWDNRYKKNEKVDEFNVSLYEGLNESTSFEINTSKVTIVYFYDVYSEEEFNNLINLQAVFENDNYDMLAISSYKNKDQNKALLEAANISNIILGYDEKDNEKLSLFNKDNSYPYYVWIDNTNKLRYSSKEFYNYNEIKNMNVILNGGKQGNQIGDYCYTTDLTEFDRTTLEDIGTYNLGDNEGKITILNFWFAGCGPCVAEIPEFGEVASKYSSDDNNFKDVNARFVYDDKDMSYYYQLGGDDGFPMSVIVDKDGYVVANVNNSMSGAELEAIILSVLNS